MKNENKIEDCNDPFEESTRYSGLSKDLKVQLQMMRARAGDFLSEEQLEMLSKLGPKNPINEQEMIEKVENALLLTFTSLQTTTAKQVLQRCIKKVTHCDQATQMGVDMFEEERVQFRRQIEFLNEQMRNMAKTVASLSETNKKLMKDKAEQSKLARGAKKLLEKNELQLKESTSRNNNLISQNEKLNS